MFGRKKKREAETVKAAPAFSEPVFLEELETLLDADEGEKALDFFLSQAGALADSNLHRRIKLNHFRYASRLIEAHTQGKHGVEKLRTKLTGILRNLAGVEIPAGGAFLDFGCGEHDPLALATVFYLNGFERAIACDLRPPHVPRYSARSMTEILTDIRANPAAYLLPSRDRGDFEKRVHAIDDRGFRAGDFDAGIAALASKVDYRLSDLVDLDVEDESLSLAISFAVLEHVEEPDAIYRWLYEKTRPGGVQFHFIDLVDHRAYLRDGVFHEWSFLTSEDGPAALNRLRAQEHLDKIAATGFEIVKSVRRGATPPEGLRDQLISPWREMSDEEIATVKLRVVLRRPE